MRTHLCGEVNETLADQAVQLCGWVDRRRDLGGLIFIGLRDHAGIVQVVVEPDSEAFSDAEAVRNEYCVRISGQVRMRPESQWNESMATGKIEVVADRVELLNASAPMPLLMTDEDGEEVRLKYRYLDLRRSRMQQNLRTRAKMYRAIRDSLDDKGFTELETPILTKATPEGARDYLVPSRVHAGQYFALPQSPQLFKQLLMMSGMDRYYQIARCFRDEDLRADRQPEFTQLDIEMAFVEEQDVQALAEKMMCEVFKDTLDVDLPTPFPRMSWHDAMHRYGSDKPDLRIPMELVSVDDHVAHVEFRVFAGPANDDGSRVAVLRVPGGAELSRKQIDEYADYAGRYGARGLAWIKVNDSAAGLEGLQSPIAKFLDDKAWQGIAEATGVQSGDILLFGAGEWLTVCTFMGALLVKCGHDRGLASEGWQPLWITEFPMFEWDEDSGRYSAMHHPFTAPVQADPEALLANPAQSLSKGYDMVLNGSEIGGGSIRIHKPEMQQSVFKLLGINEEEAQAKFGFLLEALKYGCPPHGGIAFGLDRIAALMSGESSIRDVIAFPKTTTAQCLLTSAPSAVPEEQVAELHIRNLGEDDLNPGSDKSPDHAARIGLTAALAAYIFWGLTPIYFKLLQSVAPLEIIAHRMLWSIPMMAGFLWLRDGSDFWSRMALPPKTILILLLTGVLVMANWLIFVWAVVNGQVLATSLGYFIGPLVYFLLGFLFLKERLTRIQTISVVIAASGTLYLGWFLGAPPWISLSLAFSFGFYGLIRKMLTVGPMIGLLWEALLLAPLAILFFAWTWSQGRLDFGGGDTGLDLLLVFAGLITILPLLWFNVAARTLDLTTLGFFQYIAPSMTFLLSVFIYGEDFTRGHAVAFGCIWLALILVSGETVAKRRQLSLSRQIQ